MLLAMYAYSFRNENIKNLFKVEAIAKDKLVLPEHKSDLKEFSLVCIVKFVLTEG
jgi:hypothetical protein